MNPRVILPMAVLALAAALGVAAFVLRPTPPPPKPVAPPPPVMKPEPVAPPAPPPVVRASPLPEDPALRQWVQSIQSRRREGVESSQAAFLAREGEYREPLMKMAKENEEPRVRAFSVAVLGRMKAPPPEAFFLERLDDASEYPRTSALHALEKIGTAACLPAVDRLAASDAAEAVRAAAAQAAKAVRSR